MLHVIICRTHAFRRTEQVEEREKKITIHLHYEHFLRALYCNTIFNKTFPLFCIRKTIIFVVVTDRTRGKALVFSMHYALRLHCFRVREKFARLSTSPGIGKYGLVYLSVIQFSTIVRYYFVRAFQIEFMLKSKLEFL